MKVFVVEMFVDGEWEYIGAGNEESAARSLVSAREELGNGDFLIKNDDS